MKEMKMKNKLRVLLVYPNSYLMNMLPPAMARFSALLKEQGHIVDLFDTTYHKITALGDDELSSNEIQDKHLQVRPFNLEGTKIKPKTTDVG